MLAHCSFKSAIAKSTKTITEAQEKNLPVPIDLFPRTPLVQLMQRAVMYMHQAGADGTNTPHPSKKKLLVTFGSPHILPFTLREGFTVIIDVYNCVLCMLVLMFDPA
jgi:hypothetical protein